MERVKILGLRGGAGCCGVGGIEATIKRDYPSILNSTNVDSLRWLTFCDRLDEALKSIRVVKASTVRMIQILFGFVATIVISCAILFTQTQIDQYLGTVWYFYVFIMLYLLPAIIFFRIRGNLSRKMSKVYDEVNAICIDTTNQSSGVTFELLIVRKTNGKKIWYDRYIVITLDGFTIESEDYTIATRSSRSISTRTPVDEFSVSPMENV